MGFVRLPRERVGIVLVNGGLECCSRAGHNSEKCIGLNKWQERPSLCSCCYPFIMKVLQWTTHLSGDMERACPRWNATWQEHKFTANVCLIFPYASAPPPEWSRWHSQDFHPSQAMWVRFGTWSYHSFLSEAVLGNGSTP